MEIQKEREAFERLPLAKLAIESEYVYYNQETNSYWPNEDFCPSDAPETMNFAWQAWQAAKTQAIPEGFVLVESSELEYLKADSEYFEKSCVEWTNRAYEQRAKVDDIKNEVERFKRDAETKAMIEAQEQGDD